MYIRRFIWLFFIFIFSSTDFGSVSQSGPSVSGPPVLTRVVPPIPPRPVQQAYRPTYSSFPSSYSPYGSSIYGGYSPYSYSGYGVGGGLGHNRYNLTDDIPPSHFVQQAEESSRGAFQSIESIVHAFSSVSMMMDATFSAVYNSFRAVLDVANHFSRLRVHFTKVLSAFALVRTLRYLYRRLQRLLGLRQDSEVDDLWADSAASSVISASGTRGAGIDDPRANSVKSWPIFLFLAVVLGGPYLIWKLLRSAEGPEENGETFFSLPVLSVLILNCTHAYHYFWSDMRLLKENKGYLCFIVHHLLFICLWQWWKF